MNNGEENFYICNKSKFESIDSPNASTEWLNWQHYFEQRVSTISLENFMAVPSCPDPEKFSRGWGGGGPMPVFGNPPPFQRSTHDWPHVFLFFAFYDHLNWNFTDYIKTLLPLMLDSCNGFRNYFLYQTSLINEIFHD